MNKNIEIIFEFFAKHEMPEYDRNGNFLREDEKNDITLRIPINIKIDTFNLKTVTMMVASRTSMEKYRNKHKRLFACAAKIIPKYFTEQSGWDMFSEQKFDIDYEIGENFPRCLTKEQDLIFKKKCTISEEEYSSLLKTAQIDYEARNTHKKIVKKLGALSNSDPYFFQYYASSIRELLNHLNGYLHCAPLHQSTGFGYLRGDFDNIMKRKIKNHNYQGYLRDIHKYLDRISSIDWWVKTPPSSEAALKCLDKAAVL